MAINTTSLVASDNDPNHMTADELAAYIDQMIEDDEDLDVIEERAGITFPRMLNALAKAEMVKRGTMFCLVDFEVVDSKYEDAEGNIRKMIRYLVLIPDKGKLVPASFVLGFDNQRAMELGLLKKKIDRYGYAHSLKIIELPSSKQGMNAYKKIVQAKDEQGERCCDGHTLEHTKPRLTVTALTKLFATTIEEVG